MKRYCTEHEIISMLVFFIGNMFVEFEEQSSAYPLQQTVPLLWPVFLLTLRRQCLYNDDVSSTNNPHLLTGFHWYIPHRTWDNRNSFLMLGCFLQILTSICCYDVMCFLSRTTHYLENTMNNLENNLNIWVIEDIIYWMTVH